MSAAVALLIVIGLVKPVSARGSFAQRAWENFPVLRPWIRPRIDPPVRPERTVTELYVAPSWWRRMLSLLGGAALSAVVGVVCAVIVGTAAIWFIGSLMGRLK